MGYDCIYDSPADWECISMADCSMAEQNYTLLHASFLRRWSEAHI